MPKDLRHKDTDSRYLNLILAIKQKKKKMTGFPSRLFCYPRNSDCSLHVLIDKTNPSLGLKEMCCHTMLKQKEDLIYSSV